MVIVVFGLPGTGKSFFAQQLAQLLHASYYNTDIVRKQLDKKGNYSDQHKQQVYQELVSLARVSLHNQKQVVVDGTFSKKQYRQLLAEVASEEGADIFWIQTTADDTTIRQRVRQSRKHSEADYAVYQKVRAEFEAADFSHLVLDSSRLTVEEMIQKARHFIFSSHDSN